MSAEIPVARRVYLPQGGGPDPEARACPACGRVALTPWYLRRDQARHVWRRWVCHACQHGVDLPEDASA
jgi:hypothetical protein